MIFNRLISTLCFSLILSGLAGCGSSNNEYPRAAVRGIVLLDGEPLPEGIIRFIPQGPDKGPKSSAEIRVGMFKVDEEYGPVVGSHRIEIESTDDGGYARDDEQALDRLKAEGIKQIKVVKVPAIYNNRSQLTTSVTLDGPNDFTFELSTNPKKQNH